MLELVIQGLNMTALNALIHASAVLAKMGVAAAVVGGILWLIVFALSVISE